MTLEDCCEVRVWGVLILNCSYCGLLWGSFDHRMVNKARFDDLNVRNVFDLYYFGCHKDDII